MLTEPVCELDDPFRVLHRPAVVVNGDPKGVDEEVVDAGGNLRHCLLHGSEKVESNCVVDGLGIAWVVDPSEHVALET